MLIKNYLIFGITELTSGIFMLLLWFATNRQYELLILSLILIVFGIVTLIYLAFVYIFRKTPILYKQFVVVSVLSLLVTLLSAYILAKPAYDLINVPNPEYLNNLAKDTDRICLNSTIELTISHRACTHSQLTRESQDTNATGNIDAKLFSNLGLDVYVFSSNDRSDAQSMWAYRERYLGRIQLTGNAKEYKAKIIENDKYVAIALSSKNNFRIFVLEKESFEIYQADTLDFENNFEQKSLLRIKFAKTSGKIAADVQEYKSTKVQSYEFDIKQKAISLQTGN